MGEEVGWKQEFVRYLGLNILNYLAIVVVMNAWLGRGSTRNNGKMEVRAYLWIILRWAMPRRLWTNRVHLKIKATTGQQEINTDSWNPIIQPTHNPQLHMCVAQSRKESQSHVFMKIFVTDAHDLGSCGRLGTWSSKLSESFFSHHTMALIQDLLLVQHGSLHSLATFMPEHGQERNKGMS